MARVGRSSQHEPAILPAVNAGVKSVSSGQHRQRTGAVCVLTSECLAINARVPGTYAKHGRSHKASREQCGFLLRLHEDSMHTPSGSSPCPANGQREKSSVRRAGDAGNLGSCPRALLIRSARVRQHAPKTLQTYFVSSTRLNNVNGSSAVPHPSVAACMAVPTCLHLRRTVLCLLDHLIKQLT